jgi:hypothetical protein
MKPNQILHQLVADLNILALALFLIQSTFEYGVHPERHPRTSHTEFVALCTGF